VSSQAEDGELVVRKLRTGQEFKHPRGTGGQFSPDGKFVIFTIAQSKADEERERQQNRARAREAENEPGGETTTPPPGEARQQSAAPAGRQGGAAGRGPSTSSGRGNQRRNEPRTGLGIISLADGKVTAVDKVGSFKVPDENAKWLAYYKGTGGAGDGDAAGGRGGRGGGAPPAGGRGGRGRGRAPAATARHRGGGARDRGRRAAGR
jgi:translation initiation factor IF-2